MRIVLGLTFAAVVATASTAVAEVDGVLADLGQPLFQRHCASCHGLDGRGDGPVSEVLRTAPADLTRIAERRGGDFPEGEIARYIDGRFEVGAHGPREMPVWGERFSNDVPDSALAEELTRGRIVTLIEYLQSIQIETTEP